MRNWPECPRPIACLLLQCSIMTGRHRHEDCGSALPAQRDGSLAIMLSMGLQVKLEDLLASARPARRLVMGLLANYVWSRGSRSDCCRLPGRPDGLRGLPDPRRLPRGPGRAADHGRRPGRRSLAVGMMLILAGLSALLSPALLSVFLARIGPGSSSTSIIWRLSGPC